MSNYGCRTSTYINGGRFNPRVKMLEKQGHDPADLHKAIDRGYGSGDNF